MNEISVSFCIPACNSAEKTIALVEKLLKIQSYKIQVCVSDNCSDDNTVELLNKINDSRLKILTHERNVGPKLNFLHALDMGDYEYLYFFIGRDSVDPVFFGRLSNVLVYLKENSIGYCYDKHNGRGVPRVRVQEGLVAFCEHLGTYHQTGMIFLREAYISIPNRIQYFGEDTDYAENFVKRDILIDYKSATIYNLGFSVVREDNISNRKSQFEPEKKTQYFYPERLRKTFNVIINMMSDNELTGFSDEEKNLFVLNRFETCLITQIEMWKLNHESEIYSSHYGIEQRHVGKGELIRDAFNTYCYIKNNNRFSFDIRQKIYRKFVVVVKRILGGDFE